MIKIKPFFSTDAAQVRALLRHQDQPVSFESFCNEDKILASGMKFFQHWLPCNLHIGPSVYVAKEDGVALGLITLHSLGKSKNCWRIDQLVVHKSHRGRGIAQELLQYAMALFGGQGINHFVSEISNQNSKGMNLLNNCGFRRCLINNYYQVPLDFEPPDLGDLADKFRIAKPKDKQKIYELHQSLLPQDVRRILERVPDDYYMPELNADTKEKMARRLLRRKKWFWIHEDESRGVVPCAAKVSAHGQGNFYVEIFVNPGYSHMTPEIINFVLSTMKEANMKGTIVFKAHDFQKELNKELENREFERVGSFLLMAREHWQRAKKSKKLKLDPKVSIPNLGTPAVNVPFAGSFERNRNIFEITKADDFDSKESN